MSWLRMDDSFAEHPKLESLTDREFRIWMRLLCYCARQEDPTVDRITVRSIPGLTPRFVSKLHQLSLLDEVQNAYEIHDWIHYRPKDKTGAERQARYRARRLNHAEGDRLSTVTPTVTETVTPDRYSDRDENVTPDQTSTSPEVLTSTSNRSEGTNNALLDVKTELVLAELLDWIGGDQDSRTAAVLRHTLSEATEAAIVELRESLPRARPRHRAKWVIGTLKQATERAKAVA